MKKTRSQSPYCRFFQPVALTGFLWLTASSAFASPGHDRFDSCFGVRGEAARQLRRIFENQYRSRNVYRSSRHADPWQNPYRSSRHYQRELALSHDGYVVRTVVHGDLDHHILDPGLSPCLPPPCNYTACSFPRHLAHEHFDPVAQIEDATTPPLPAIPLIQSSSLDESPARQPTQRPIMKQVSLSNGRTKTIITSVPIEKNTPTTVETSSRESG